MKHALITNDNGVYVKNLTDELLDEALQLMRNYFYVDEQVSQAYLKDCPEAIDDIQQLIIESVKDNVSLVAFNKDGLMVGASFNKIQCKPAPGEESYFEEYMNKRCRNEASKKFMYLMINVDSRVDMYNKFDVDKSLELMFLVTNREYRGQGVGTLLVKAAQQIALTRGVRLCTTICTSLGTERICLYKLQWEQILCVPNHEFSHRGLSLEHYSGGKIQNLVLAAKLLSST